jgi:hypothetical protein
MSEAQALIPPPAVVRERLGMAVREAQWLRSLLRLSVRAAEERHRIEQAQRTTSAAPAMESAR